MTRLFGARLRAETRAKPSSDAIYAVFYRGINRFRSPDPRKQRATESS
jgi:hypothetical protein